MNFSQSTIRAEDGVQRLKNSTSQMQKSVAEAQSLRDDLALLIDRGSLTADRLEEGVRENRSQEIDVKPSVPKNELGTVDIVSNKVSIRGTSIVNKIKTAHTPDKDNRQVSPKEQKSQAEKDLIEALRQAR
jgi:hypothetical protein